MTLSLFGFGSYFNIVKATNLMSAHIFARYSRILANKNRFLVKYKTAHIGNPHGNQSQKLAVCEPLHLIIKCQTHINQKSFYQCSQHFGASQNFLTSKEDQISEKESQEPTFR